MTKLVTVASSSFSIFWIDFNKHFVYLDLKERRLKEDNEIVDGISSHTSPTRKTALDKTENAI